MRKVTNKILDLVTEGMLSPQVVMEACLQYMNEDDVAEMARQNDLIIDLEGEVDDFDDEDDGQPDEMQEWHDFDPDC